MQPIHSTSHPSGSTRGFATLDPERQGVLISSLRRPSTPFRAPGFGGPLQRPAPTAKPQFAGPAKR
jgi:hypothetical protein